MTRAAFDEARFHAEREARGLRLGAEVSWQRSTESTNDDALRAARDGARHGAVFGAESQTRGRGRRGSEWISSPGEGLWFSLLLRPSFAAELAPGLALVAGLSVREAAARRVAAKVQVKWPNDVLSERRKLSGVLVESQLSGSRLTSAVVGIGVNVTQGSFPSEIAEIATSLELLGASDAGREVLLGDVLEAFELRLARLERCGLAGIADELRAHDALLGERLTVDEREGVGAGIDDSGRLLLRLADGSVEPCVSGHLRLLDAN